jgi:hypothetical protein
MFQWHRSQIKVPSKSTGIIKTSGCAESVRVLRRCLLGYWPVYHVEAQKGRDRESRSTLGAYIQ